MSQDKNAQEKNNAIVPAVETPLMQLLANAQQEDNKNLVTIVTLLLNNVRDNSYLGV